MGRGLLGGVLLEGAGLLEAAAGGPVESVYAKALLQAATTWRQGLRGMGDDWLEAVDEVGRAAEGLQGVDTELDRERALADFQDAVQRFSRFLTGASPAYTTFASGRDLFYTALSDVGLKPTRKGAGAKKGASEDPAAATDEALVAQVVAGAKAFEPAVKKMLDAGARAVKLFLSVSQADDKAQGQAVLNAGLDYRDAVSEMFGRAKGLAKRSEELLRRVWRKHTYEARGWRGAVPTPWDSDPEIPLL